MAKRCTETWLKVTMNATIKVITLDLDNTLWCTWPVIARANECLHNYISEKYPAIAKKFPPETWRPLQDKIMETNPSIRTDFTKIRKKAIEYCALQCNLSDPEQISEEVFDIFIQSRNATQDFLFPGVVHTLESLKKRGFTIGSLSNGNADITKMEHLDPFFSFNIGSAGKPDKAPFQLAFDLAKEHCKGLVSPGQVLHVGDSLHSDVIPAKQFGFRTVWVKTGEDGGTTVVPEEVDFELDAFSEILKLEILSNLTKG